MSSSLLFDYLAGTSGTVTVPANFFVTGIQAHASVAGASLTVTPVGADGGGGIALAAIPIASGSTLALGGPAILGHADEIGPTSSMVFASTDSFLVTLRRFP